MASPITVGNNPFGIAATPDGAHVYVANAGDVTVSVIRTSDNTVTATITTTLGTPAGVAISSDGVSVYVTDEGSKGRDDCCGVEYRFKGTIPWGVPL